MGQERGFVTIRFFLVDPLPNISANFGTLPLYLTDGKVR